MVVVVALPLRTLVQNQVNRRKNKRLPKVMAWGCSKKSWGCLWFPLGNA